LILQKAIRRFKEEGTASLIIGVFNFLYNRTLRRASPPAVLKYNSVRVRTGYLIDRIFPFVGGGRPNYETGIVEGIRNHVRKGESVVIVGGGLGVATVVAARHVGEHGDVTCLEGSTEQIKKVRETMHLNNVSSRVRPRHALVGSDYAVWGEKGNPDRIAPNELPDCDVLIMDCEGAERDVLNNTDIQPEIIIVETHGIYDSPKSVVRDLLEKRGYEILSTRLADDDMLEKHERLGVYVIVAKYYS
jgi:hypothetical protein